MLLYFNLAGDSSLFPPVFFHKLLEISSSRLGSETEACGKWVFFRAKPIVGRNLTWRQGLCLCFVFDTFKFLCDKRNVSTLVNTWTSKTNKKFSNVWFQKISIPYYRWHQHFNLPQHPLLLAAVFHSKSTYHQIFFFVFSSLVRWFIGE